LTSRSRSNPDDFGMFVAGPPATADVEGIVFYDAQDAWVMTALLSIADHSGDDPCRP